MSESIGAALKAGREQRHMTLAQVSEATRIRAHYLQALENDDLSAMPSAAQGRGFMRIYAQFLNLDLDALIPPASPPPVAGPEAPTVPVKATPPGSATAESPTEASPAAPSLLSSLRDRLTRRFRRESPVAESGATAQLEAEPDDKKKSAPLEPAEPLLASSFPEAIAPSLESTPEPSSQTEQEGLPPSSTPDPSEAPRRSVLPSLLRRLAAKFPRLPTSPPNPDSDEGETDDENQPPSPGLLTNSVDFNPLPADQQVESKSSDEIFAEIGRQLRARREMLSLTHEEIERHTHVRAAFLKALEAGKLEGLPSPVQTRGILSNYAAFIDLNADDVMLRFADGIQARHREQRPQWPPRTHSPMTVHSNLPPLRAFIASDLLFGGGAAIMLILFAVWGINRVVTLRSADPRQGGAPSISDVLAQARVPTIVSEITLIPAVDTPLAPVVEVTPEEAPTAIDPSITVQVKLSATERTYLLVLVDDQPAFEGRTEPGKDYYYQAARKIEILAGNAAALRVIHNGTDRGTLGGFGEVVDQLYTSRGVFTPTPTTPPTTTPSATPTATLKATPTLATFTPTPRAGE